MRSSKVEEKQKRGSKLPHSKIEALFFATLLLLVSCLFSPANCAADTTKREMEVTAYCACGKCNSYARGSWKFLKLDRWNRYFVAGPDKGRKYTGKTAGGNSLKPTRPGLLSGDSLLHPLRIPKRVILFPFHGFKRDGTIAADREYYPFGTRMYVPGWGWGVVDDVGGDIKGPNRIDIFIPGHDNTKEFGRQHLTVTIKQ